MARTPKAAVVSTAAPAASADVDPEAEYVVRLSRAAVVAGARLLPRNENRVKGKFIAELGDAVIAYEKV